MFYYCRFVCTNYANSFTVLNFLVTQQVDRYFEDMFEWCVKFKWCLFCLLECWSCFLLSKFLRILFYFYGLFFVCFFFFVGGLVSHQSPAFQEEFPLLAPEEKTKETKKEEENKDFQYGPGPSLRPQSQLEFLKHRCKAYDKANRCQ